jgi:hypothetical protein
VTSRPGGEAGEQTGTSPLARGRQFHLDVQWAFLTDLPGATAQDEKPVMLSRIRRGRVDLLVLPSSGEVAAVIVEIKSTDWDALAPTGCVPTSGAMEGRAVDSGASTCYK